MHYKRFYNRHSSADCVGMENNKLTIFVVEDTLFYQQMISKMLEPMAADVLFFTSGEHMMMELPARMPDMAIIDYDLDGTMTGLDTLKVMRLHQPDVYAVLFSNRANLHTSENMNAYGEFDFVEKTIEGVLRLQKKITRANCFLHVPWV